MFTRPAGRRDICEDLIMKIGCSMAVAVARAMAVAVKCQGLVMIMCSGARSNAADRLRGLCSVKRVQAGQVAPA